MNRNRPHQRQWPQACLRLARPTDAASGRRLWRGVLLALVFAALHSGLLAAWTVWQGHPTWVQVCTAEGMRWVHGDNKDQDTPVVLKKGCVWSSATWAILTPPPAATVRPLRVAFRASTWAVHRAPAPDTAQRVLLMAPMRAPPPAV